MSTNWRGTDKQKTDARGYTARWKRARLVYLAENPLCVYCARDGRDGLASIVDHKVPHQGEMELFWNVDNWQSLCKSCHDVTKRREEGRGGPWGCDADGIPNDPAHHWQKPQKP